MRLATILLFALVLSACASNGAPYLASEPTPSPCASYDKKCKELDAIEANGYELARQKKISWLQMVDGFYKKRAELYPDYRDPDNLREYRAYQRLLADEIDKGKITEIQWAYMLAQKKSEIDSRNMTCTTTYILGVAETTCR